MSNLSSVAKPADPRPCGGGGLRDCDTVEVAAGALRYLRDLAKSIFDEAQDANGHMARVSVDDPSVMDEVVESRAAALCASSCAAKIIGALDGLVPGVES